MPNINAILDRELTPGQKAAATDTSPEVLCLACAGSGKSRTLAYRIAWLLEQGEDPAGIVAFTFTEKAADAIKRRVAEALIAVDRSPTILGAMYIGTIHSYCQYVLGELDARYRQFGVLDENRLKLYLMSRYPQLHLSDLRNHYRVGYFDTINEVANAWKLINDEMIQIADVTSHDPGVGRVLQAISDSLNADQFIDFSLMIRLVVDALLRQDAGAERAVAGLKHLMVDEYQDVNPSQDVLITKLHQRSETLFVVGDDDQAIYAWRGANVSNILEFNIRYPGCTSHALSFNFRSTQAIVHTADQFAAQELGANRIVKNPQASDPPGPRHFRKIWFDTRDQEADWIANRIQSLLGTAYQERSGQIRGLTPGDFAVLMRSTRSAEQSGQPRHAAFTQALQRQNVDYTLEAGGSVFDRPQVKALRQTFVLLYDGNPSRNQAHQHFQQTVVPAFPNADFGQFTNVLSMWGRLIHAPYHGARRRVYPQQLVHDLLEAFGIAGSHFSEDTMRALGLFSKMILDVEAVYMSIDSTKRFQSIIHFLSQIAEGGYDMSTDDVLRRPDAVFVSTVHKAKGLEFPVVFVVDIEAQRFPNNRSSYRGWLPQQAIQDAINRGAYQGTREEETRLFYTAITRAERYLYVTGCEYLPGGNSRRKQSTFTQRLDHPELSNDQTDLPVGLSPSPQSPRTDETVVPTSYSQIRYYLRCPRDYQFRESYGFSPPVPALFGFGTTVHTSIGKLHEVFTDHAPTRQEAQELARTNFHLKHVPPRSNPQAAPGPYERAQESAARIVANYAEEYAEDFERRRQVEVRFEIPVRQAVISGAIDLILKEDAQGYIQDVSVVDFKTMEGGEDPEENETLHWTELAMQVQLYAKAAHDVLGENACTGAVHLLKDNLRIEVPVTEAAIEIVVQNVEWAVGRIIEGDFPMRPHPQKCTSCDFRQLCPKIPEDFNTDATPPPLLVPGLNGMKMIRAFDEFESG